MSALVLDAGALVAVDRNDRGMMARLGVAQAHGLDLRESMAFASDLKAVCRTEKHPLS